MGASVSEGRRVSSFSVLSYDGTVRASDTLVINGVTVEAALQRHASTSGGRIGYLYGATWWSTAVTGYSIPDSLLHDGVNTIVLPIRGYLYISGAYITSNDPSGPTPDPDPTPDPGPVNS